jgi:hypothetical protein
MTTELRHEINPLNPSLVKVIFKDSVPTAKKTQPVTITKINQLMLFKEIIDVYTENHTKQTNTLCGQNSEFLIVKAGGTYI